MSCSLFYNHVSEVKFWRFLSTFLRFNKITLTLILWDLSRIFNDILAKILHWDTYNSSSQDFWTNFAYFVPYFGKIWLKIDEIWLITNDFCGSFISASPTYFQIVILISGCKSPFASGFDRSWVVE